MHHFCTLSFKLFLTSHQVNLLSAWPLASPREEEAMQKCAEAEQKLRDERRRCVVLEQQLERLKLGPEKAQRVTRSRTGTYSTGVHSLTTVQV